MYVIEIELKLQPLYHFLNDSFSHTNSISDFLNLKQLATKLEALRDEYMRYAVDKCSSVLREYHSAVETITGY